MTRYIDYSQYSKWCFCPWAWYEGYEYQMNRRYSGQRDDPLALGSLVHNGLENYTKEGAPRIDDATVAEVTPTPECMRLAQVLVQGYVQKYARDVPWEVERTEEPVVFPLVEEQAGWACNSCGAYGKGERTACDCGKSATNWNDQVTIAGLAKFDGYFYVPEDTTIDSGLPGETLTLGRGWWSREYKTKNPGVDRAKWIQEWTTKYQADFQMLALQHHLDTLRDKNGDLWGGDVKGVLVCVLEKPKEYIPKRKCKGCGNMWELAIFIPTGTGEYACPYCNHHQKVKPYEPKVEPRAEFYRITVTRSPEELARAKREITMVALRMEGMRRNGMESEVPNRDHCVANRYFRPCDFMDVHRAGLTAADDPQKFVKVESLQYTGLQEAAA